MKKLCVWIQILLSSVAAFVLGFLRSLSLNTKLKNYLYQTAFVSYFKGKNDTWRRV